jgi:signal transduction histidine kinase
MVEDDGSGFNTKKFVKGFGLRNIKSRVEVLEGTVDIDSSPGKGTVTTVEIPLSYYIKHD